MKVLVCVASKYGATAEIARAVADVLAERGCEVTVIPSEEVGAIEEFDAVVLGSAVYMGQWMKPARELVERSSAALAARPVGCSPAAQLASRPSPPTAPSTSRRSSRPPKPATTGSSPASWPGSTSASPTGRWPRPSAPPRATSATGPTSAPGPQASPTPCSPDDRRLRQLPRHARFAENRDAFPPGLACRRVS